MPKFTLPGDFRFALRSLGRNPGFAAAAILSLGLGIGANTAIFTLADQVMLRSLLRFWTELQRDLSRLPGTGLRQRSCPDPALRPRRREHRPGGRLPPPAG